MTHPEQMTAIDDVSGAALNPALVIEARRFELDLSRGSESMKKSREQWQLPTGIL